MSSIANINYVNQKSAYMYYSSGVINCYVEFDGGDQIVDVDLIDDSDGTLVFSGTINTSSGTTSTLIQTNISYTEGTVYQIKLSDGLSTDTLKYRDMIVISASGSYNSNSGSVDFNTDWGGGFIDYKNSGSSQDYLVKIFVEDTNQSDNRGNLKYNSVVSRSTNSMSLDDNFNDSINSGETETYILDITDDEVAANENTSTSTFNVTNLGNL